MKEYIKLNTRPNFSYQKKYKYLIDNSCMDAGSCNAYYWQDLWAATKIIDRHPERHWDIGSRIDGFIAHLQAARQKTTLIDIRPCETEMPYISFIQADATNLQGIPDNSIESISALCSLEHFGLGRYGDSIDPEACFKAFSSIQRVLKSGGHAYIAVPVGKERVEFNAHRIFYISTIIEAFSECDVEDICVNTLGEHIVIEKVTDIHKFDNETDFHAGRFGLFEFVKR